MHHRSWITAIAAIGATTLALMPSAAVEAQVAAPVVEVIAEDYAFSAPAEIPSGWTTIRFRNEGAEPHFILLSRLPEGRTIDDYQRDLSANFNRAWLAVRDDGVPAEDAMAELFGVLPDWFPELEFVGGPGITAAGRTSEATLNLEPGNYVIECYMKTPEGEFHYMEGMVRPVRIADTGSEATPPDADVRITLSNFAMAVDGPLTPGRHMVEVHIAENPEVGFGHNVHVARLDGETDVDALVRWMNAFDHGGLRSPGPATFLGGVQIMPTGSTAYFPLELEPGRYLLLSEYTGHQGVLHEFTVDGT